MNGDRNGSTSREPLTLQILGYRGLVITPDLVVQLIAASKAHGYLLKNPLIHELQLNILVALFFVISSGHN